MYKSTLILRELHTTQRLPHDVPRLSSVCSTLDVRNSVVWYITWILQAECSYFMNSLRESGLYQISTNRMQTALATNKVLGVQIVWMFTLPEQSISDMFRKSAIGVWPSQRTPSTRSTFCHFSPIYIITTQLCKVKSNLALGISHSLSLSLPMSFPRVSPVSFFPSVLQASPSLTNLLHLIDLIILIEKIKLVVKLFSSFHVLINLDSTLFWNPWVFCLYRTAGGCIILHILVVFKSRDNSVGIALGYGLDDRGSRVRFPVRAGNFSLHHRVQNGSSRGSFPEGKAAGAWSWPLISI
jgi:hypothetical protein